MLGYEIRAALQKGGERRVFISVGAAIQGEIRQIGRLVNADDRRTQIFAVDFFGVRWDVIQESEQDVWGRLCRLNHERRDICPRFHRLDLHACSDILAERERDIVKGDAVQRRVLRGRKRDRCKQDDGKKRRPDFHAAHLFQAEGVAFDATP